MEMKTIFAAFIVLTLFVFVTGQNHGCKFLRCQNCCTTDGECTDNCITMSQELNGVCSEDGSCYCKVDGHKEMEPMDDDDATTTTAPM